MALEDFERELAGDKGHDSKERSSRHSHRHRNDDRGRHGEHQHRHHRRSHRRREDEREDGSRQHRKRARNRREDEQGSGQDEEHRHHKKRRSASPRVDKKPENEVKVFDSSESEDDWIEKEAATAPPEENILDQRDQDLAETRVQRDAWMQEPSALDIDYVQSKKPKAPTSQFVGAKHSHEFKVHESDVKRHLADLQRDFDSDEQDEGDTNAVENEPAQHEVSYTFGDSGSSWRMTKLKAVYRKAEEGGISVDDVALERYGNYRDFDDAREEERELDRRKLYGREYVGLEKPSGELFQERKMEAGLRRNTKEDDTNRALPQAMVMEEAENPSTTVALDQTALNKLKAQMMKAKLRDAPNAAQLEEEYRVAETASLANKAQSDVIVLDKHRMLAGDRSGEVNAVSGKRGRERGLVVENEDMSIEDMVKQERRTRGTKGGEGKAFAERIAKDSKFIDDLDYMDDNASKLSKKVIQSDGNLRNAAIGDFQKMQKILGSCPLCYNEESNSPPTAPVVSLATRTYMTLTTEPEIAKGGAVIVPLQHRLNLLECDDDEWEEMRNFMKALTRYYHSQDKGVVFYENAAHMHSRKGHAALTAIPLAQHLAATAPAYFKEAILASDEQWSQHQPIIDTLALSQKRGYGKAALRKAMVKEMPYFHVFYTLDGGMGHVVEDERRWPKGDLFAREIIGGMLDKGPEVIKKQGRWERHDRRLEGFRKKWGAFDWTKVLMDAQ